MFKSTDSFLCSLTFPCIPAIQGGPKKLATLPNYH